MLNADVNAENLFFFVVYKFWMLFVAELQMLNANGMLMLMLRKTEGRKCYAVGCETVLILCGTPKMRRDFDDRRKSSKCQLEGRNKKPCSSAA